MASELKNLHLLGGFRVEINGCPIAVPAAASKLLAFLALHERSVSRAELAATFWPECGDERAKANLRATLWRLPRAVRPMIRTTSTTLTLATDVRADVRNVHDSVDRVLHDGELPSDVHDLIDLLRLPLLPEFHEDWLLYERERMRQLHIHALERIGERYLADGDAMSAVDVAGAVIAAEALRESAHSLLIRAHQAAGNRLDAQRSYEQYREILRRELSMSPSPDLLPDHASLMHG